MSVTNGPIYPPYFSAGSPSSPDPKRGYDKTDDYRYYDGRCNLSQTDAIVSHAKAGFLQKLSSDGGFILVLDFEGFETIRFEIDNMDAGSLKAVVDSMMESSQLFQLSFLKRAMAVIEHLENIGAVINKDDFERITCAAVTNEMDGKG